MKRNLKVLSTFFLSVILAAAPAAGIYAASDSASHREPVKIILDTDMISDYDDMGAMACLHAMADAGECEILATVSCTRNNGSVAAVEICNTYYGRGDIPVGCSKIDSAVSWKDRRGHKKFLDLQDKYPGWFKYANSDDAPDAVEVYRRVLAAQKDGSVVICSIGFLSNLRALLESKGDAHSPLDGRTLVARKVKKWVAMACFYPQGHEYNSDGDPVSSKIALRDWPTPIVITDFQYGRHLYSGRALLEKPQTGNPVYDVFKAALTPKEKITPRSWDQHAGHPSWDQSAVLIAVRGEESYFALEHGFYEMTDDKGSDIWRYDPSSPSCRVVQKFPRIEVGRIIDELMLRKPKSASVR
jgi:inosine-uridine nucleoside N-ribohydrolase